MRIFRNEMLVILLGATEVVIGVYARPALTVCLGLQSGRARSRGCELLTCGVSPSWIVAVNQASSRYTSMRTGTARFRACVSSTFRPGRQDRSAGFLTWWPFQPSSSPKRSDDTGNDGRFDEMTAGDDKLGEPTAQSPPPASG